ncbi:MAG: TRAP transporter small permease [Sedimentibacter sp.]
MKCQVYKLLLKGMNNMKKLLLWLDKHIEELLLTVFLMGIVAFMTIHVFCRYVLRSPLVWTEELTRYMFIWFVFMGFSYGIKSSTHIRVDILETFVSKLKPGLTILQDIVTTAFLVYLVPAGIEVLKFFIRTGQRSTGLNVPMLFIYVSLMIGIILSIFRMAEKWFLILSNRKKEIVEGVNNK